MEKQYLYQNIINQLNDAKTKAEFDKIFEPFMVSYEHWKKEFESAGVDFNRFGKVEVASKEEVEEKIDVAALTKMVIDKPIEKNTKKVNNYKG